MSCQADQTPLTNTKFLSKGYSASPLLLQGEGNFEVVLLCGSEVRSDCNSVHTYLSLLQRLPLISSLAAVLYYFYLLETKPRKMTHNLSSNSCDSCAVLFKLGAINMSKKY